MEELTTVYFLPFTISGGAWNSNKTTKSAIFPLLLTSVSPKPLSLGLERVFITYVFSLVWQDSEGGDLEKNTSETWYVYLIVLNFWSLLVT